MNLYLYCGVGHKQSVLKSKDQDRSNTEQTIKYNLKSTTRKHPKTGAVVGKKKALPETVRVVHAPPPEYPLQQLNTKSPERHQAQQQRRKRGHHARPKE
jgi:hypothetical protein